MESPGILVVDVYTYTGIPLATEYIFIKNYSCPSSPYCKCFLQTENFTARCDVASAVLHCSRQSSKFAVSSNHYACNLKSSSWRRRRGKSWRCLVNINFVLHMELYCQVDYAWSERLALLSYKWSLLVDATAWLSTLGGGHSALGEHSLVHAHKAGNLSMKQFKLALELGDRGLEYRCRLYYSLSLIQRGRLSQSKRLVRRIFSEAKKSLNDERLLAMCQGVWSKLKYHYSVRKQQKQISSSCSTNDSFKLEGRNR